MIIDSWFDNYVGVVMLVRVVDGRLATGDKIKLMATESLSNAEKQEKVEKVLALVKIIAPKPEPKPEPVAVKPEPKPEPRPEPKPEPVAVKPKPEPKPEPRVEPKPKPEPVAPKPKGSGKLACTSKPVGPEVWIDGRNTGKKTPVPKSAALDLPFGKHKIPFKLDGKSAPVQEIVIGEEHKADPLVVKGEF